MPSHRLSIYVQCNCVGSLAAAKIAKTVMDWHIDGLVIEIIDLNSPEVIRPEVVFAVPTYLLNGEVISLGTPDIQDLQNRLEKLKGVPNCQ